MTADDFREVMRRFPTGITIVTTIGEDGKPRGLTANAIASVSLDPPMVLVCVSRQARSHPMIAHAGKFCLNILALEQQGWAVRFAAHDKTTDPFTDVATHTGATGAPVLDEALAYLDCELAEEHTAGTHTIFLGNVVGCGYRSGAPLGYFNAGYHDFGLRIP
jgi:flavin reductase (DIM6/NTAB) family NADH-FMN oxidoreductase RutF